MCALVLLPPTVLMGATLPAIARWVESTPRGVSWLGILYTANIVGAVFGCLLAGFYLLRVHDMAIATYVAVTINLSLAAVAFVLAWWTEPRLAAEAQAPEARRAARVRRVDDLRRDRHFRPHRARLLRWCGPVCWRCKWAPRSTRSPSSWRCS